MPTSKPRKGEKRRTQAQDAGGSGAPNAAGSAESENAGSSSGPSTITPTEATCRLWLTPRQQQAYAEQLNLPDGVVKETALTMLIDEKLRLHAESGQDQAMLDGLTSRPSLNGRQVRILGPKQDGRYPVRVKCHGHEPEEILVRPQNLLPAEQTRSRPGRGKHKSGSGANGEAHTPVTTISLDLDSRREELLKKAEALELNLSHIAAHREHLNVLAEKLMKDRSALQKRYQITEGLLKQTKDADKILMLMQKQEAIKTQERTFNFNVQRVKDEGTWLEQQPAVITALKTLKEEFTSSASGTVFPTKQLEEDEQKFSFEDLLEEMKAEDKAEERLARGGSDERRQSRNP